jgi:nonribosomal peptide synthetase DhbF
VLLPLRPAPAPPTRTARLPLFCVHPAVGVSWCYAGLLAQLDPRVPVFGLQCRGLTEPDRLPADLPAMAADYVRQIRHAQPAGPYQLLGWSVGGLVAQEMAVQLRQAGEPVELLALLDSYPMDSLDPDEHVPVGVLLDDLRFAPGPGDCDDRDDLDVAVERVRAAGGPLATLDRTQLQAMYASYRNALRISRQHRPRPYDGNLVFFRAAQDGPHERPPVSAWSGFVTGDIDEHIIDCAHTEMTQPGPLARISAVLTDRLTAIPDSAPSAKTLSTATPTGASR